MNIDDLKKVVSDICQVLNAVSKFVNKGGVLSLWGAISPVQDLATINWGLVKSELLNLNAAGKAELDATIASQLQLVNPAVQAKVISGVDCAEQLVNLAEEGISLFNQGQLLVGKIKLLVGA